MVATLVVVLVGNGKGVGKNPTEVVKWYRLAADQGNAGAQCNLGLCYENGEGVGKNPTDNGPEFSEHERIAEKLGTKVYFAAPYCSWQKGHIENTNMLYREYIPCDGHFLEHSDEEIREIQYKLNRRPRKKSVSGCHIKNFSYICRCSCILVWNLPWAFLSIKICMFQKK